MSAYVKGCMECNQNKKATVSARHPMLSYHSGSPMERVHLDFIGPLPRTERGNEHILMMVDQFTKWVECIPLPSQSAEETARAAVNQFFSRFGCPFQVFTDQGRNFESSLFREMCELLHIHKSRTTPYRPSANGQVERCNRTLMAAVRCFIGKNQRSWDKYLPQLAGALRSSVNRSTGYTPNMMMLGREIGLPAELMFGSPGNTGQPEGDQYVGELQTAIEGAHRVARETLKQSQKRMKRDYDVKARVRELKLGDLVYQLDTATVKGQTRKLSPSWKGPGVVIEKLTPYLYKIKLKRVIITANHDRLKLCHDREVPEWAQKLSQQMIKGTGYTKEKGGVKDQRGYRAKLYCVCQKPYTGEFMIRCDECKEWYHGDCVRITQEEAKAMGDFVCSGCHRHPRGKV